ncbi:hypothetical protein XHV734_0308 [Xanthomonas hortorum pv. vitians]|nr:hypothetical protein XHV734_0308 [Xanthomonas hortorum pv. vitians]
MHPNSTRLRSHPHPPLRGTFSRGEKEQPSPSPVGRGVGVRVRLPENVAARRWCTDRSTLMH